MKFSYAIIFLLCSLFLISGCKNSNKIQKNSAFGPICENGHIHCEKGKSACGTESGSGEMKAYCIDSDDAILKVAGCISQEDEQPVCTQLINQEVPTTVAEKIQKNLSLQ